MPASILVNRVRPPNRAHSYFIIDVTKTPGRLAQVLLRRKPMTVRVRGTPKRGWYDMKDGRAFDAETCKTFDRACQIHETNIQLASIRDTCRRHKTPPPDELIFPARCISGGPSDYTKDGVPVYEIG